MCQIIAFFTDRNAELIQTTRSSHLQQEVRRPRGSALEHDSQC